MKSKNSDRYFERKQDNETQARSMHVSPNRVIEVTDVDLKVDDSSRVSEDQQAKDLSDLDEVKEQPATNQQVAHENEEPLDFQAQGVGVNLNEQQGRNVMMTYSSQRRRRTRAKT